MAKQSGILLTQGAINNLQFVRGSDGNFRVRRKAPVNKKMIATGPQFERTRQLMSNFNTALKAEKLILDGLTKLVESFHTVNTRNRLVSQILEVMKADALNEPGNKTVVDGDISRLVGFEFNPKGTITKFFKDDYSATVDRVRGRMAVQFPAFVPTYRIVAPFEATHFQFHLAALELDMINRKSAGISSTAKLPINTNLVNTLRLEASVTPNSPNPLLLVFGIQFWTEDVNRTFYAVENPGCNGAAIVAASNPDHFKKTAYE